MRESIGRTIAQFLAHHIAWVPVVFGVFLITNPDLSSLGLPSTNYVFSIACFLIFWLVPFACYAFAYFAKTSKFHFVAKILNLFAGFISFAAMLLFFLSFETNGIVLAIAIQQTIIGFLLLIFTEKNGFSKTKAAIDHPQKKEQEK